MVEGDSKKSETTAVQTLEVSPWAWLRTLDSQDRMNIMHMLGQLDQILPNYAFPTAHTSRTKGIVTVAAVGSSVRKALGLTDKYNDIDIVMARAEQQGGHFAYIVGTIVDESAGWDIEEGDGTYKLSSTLYQIGTATALPNGIGVWRAHLLPQKGKPIDFNAFYNLEQKVNGRAFDRSSEDWFAMQKALGMPYAILQEYQLPAKPTSGRAK